MKIAEALTKIKDLKGKSAKLHQTLMADATFQVIDSFIKAPDSEVTINELTQILEEIKNTKVKIDTANVKYGLTSKIKEMEQLRYAIKILEPLTFLKQETKKLERCDYDSPPSPVLTVATYNVSALTERVENMRNKVRQLDLELQRANWELDV